MIDRFLGADGKRHLVAALRAQQIVQGNEDLASELATAVDLRQLAPGALLINQDATDNDMYFVLSGSLSVVVNGREIAIRGPGTHVGEMTLIDPTARRSASVVAIGDALVARISEPTLATLANKYPKVWRLLAIELASRLRQRNRFVRTPNPRPVVFIGSSKETLPTARAIAEGLDSPAIVVRLWSDDVFQPSHAALEDLEHEATNADFAILVFGPDDIVISRTVVTEGPRDNVLIELGLFMGAISRERTFFVRPRGVSLKLPSDLFGLTPLEYDLAPAHSLADAVRPICEAIMRIAERLGSK